MTAHDFADRLKSGFYFGTNAAVAAEALRYLADRLERGEVALQQGKVVSIAKVDDFAVTHVRLTFAEKQPV